MTPGQRPGRSLVLLRHGESVANREDFFAGWQDVPLTGPGARQASAAAEALTAAGLEPDRVHVSALGRAVDTAHLVLDALGSGAPVRSDWRLNERHYGELQGLAKDVARARFGAELVEQWRRDPAAAPPPACPEQVVTQLVGSRYAAFPEARAVRTESLGDLADRMAPLWWEVLHPDVSSGGTVLVVSHGNAIRALCHLASGVPLAEAALLPVPTAVPLVSDESTTLSPVTTPAPVR